MRHAFAVLVGAALMCAALAAPVRAESPVVTRLPNGLTVLVKEDDRFPLVSLRLYVHAGSAYETPEIAGLSHLLEHMVFKGTEKFPKGAVAETVERSGGYLNAATSFDYTMYLTDMTEENWKEGLTVLKEQAFRAVIDPAELEPEKDVVVAELKRGEDSPQQRLFRLTQEKALAGTPYERPIIGTEQTIRSITAERMHASIQEFYQPQSRLRVGGGKVKAKDALAEAEKVFGDLKNTRNVVPAEPLPVPERARFSVNDYLGPWNKVYLSVAVPVVGGQDADAPALDLLAQLLGGDATSRFYREYKYEKRLVDSISVSNYSFERVGLFYIQAVLDADKLEAFWTAFTKDMAALPGVTFSPEEMQRAKFNLEDELLRSKETLSGDASKLGWFYFFDKGAQAEADYLKMMRDTDQAKLTALITQTFQARNMSVTLLTPADAAPVVGPADAQPKPQSTAEFIGLALAQNMRTEAAPATAAPAASTAEAVNTVEVGGMKVVLMSDRTLPYASATLIFSGGDALLPSADQGLATFTASLLTRGTDKLSAMQMEDFQSDRAASLSASAGRQSFSLSVDAPSRYLDDMFGLLESTLTRPAMAKEEAARVRENQTASITQREESPTGLAFRRMFPFLFGSHPYGYLSQGEKDAVAKFDETKARAFWREQIAQPCVLVVAGDYDEAQVLAAAKTLSTALGGGKEKRLETPEWTKEKALGLHLPGRNQAHLMLVFPTVGYGDLDEPGLDLLQNVLAGQSGLLFADLRDKEGLGYTVTAFPWKAQKTGAMIFYIGTSPDKLEAAREGFRRVIDKLHKETVSANLVEGAKNKMLGDYYREHQTVASRCSEAAVLSILGRPLDAERKLVDSAQKVTPEQLRELAVKYIQFDKSREVTVLP